VIDEDLADFGVRFHSTVRVITTVSAPSPPNVIRNEGGEEIQVTFLDPVTREPGVTRFVTFKKPAGFIAGMIVEVFASGGALLDGATSTSNTEETFHFDRRGIAKLICRPPAQGIALAMDDLGFGSPETETTLDQDGDRDIDAADLLILLRRIKSRQGQASLLVELAGAWHP
jgi:hypothetical protein